MATTSGDGPNESTTILQLAQLSTDSDILKTPEPLTDQAPRLSFFKLFMTFLWFGLRAWGGPVAQIQAIQQQLVIEEKWITREKFNRVLAVYQVLPGPEATELCCYFGLLSRGRLGAFIAGLGFVLPGFILMMLFSWLYSTYNALDNPVFKASFLALQPTVVAMVFRATHKISEHAFADPHSHQFSYWLFALGALAALSSVMRVNFFITLVFCGMLYLFIERRKDGIIWYILAIVVLIAGFVIWVVWIVLRRKHNRGDDTSASGSGSIEIDHTHALGYEVFAKKTLYSIFLLGLLAGLLTFGGAYTAIPFVSYYAVDLGQWLTPQQFMDGLAIGAILPSPLVIFSTFVGFLGGGPIGAILMTIGMFLPAFSFTIIGHDFFERIVQNQSCSAFLDGVTAGVVGLIATTAVELFKQAMTAQPNPAIGAVIFVVSLGSLYHFTNKFTGPLVVFASALAGQILYLN